jgi:hypothetical protein
MTSMNSLSSAPAENEKEHKGQDRSEIREDILHAGVALSARETVGRFGSANAEYIKGYRGIDHETGQQFAKGLAGISKYKVSPESEKMASNNIKQQAGFSAEIASTSRDNAEAIIQGSKIRTSRSDDLPQYGKNHNVVDRVQILDGQIIEGSQTQMKFVGDRNGLFEKIAREDGKFARYRGVKLELPSEQYEGAKAFCQQRAGELREQAQQVERHGKPEVAAELRSKAANYEQLAENVSDSGLTTEQAIFYRKHPKLATLRDIAATSHRAGMEGAKYGALIGGCISLFKNSFAVAQDEMKLRNAATQVGQDIVKAGALGYGTAAVGAAIKAGMQQSGYQTLRGMANTSAPTLVVNICLSLGSSVKRYVRGDISEADLLIEVGEKGAGMLSSGMMAALGQIAIPVPFVGAAIGGMVGYTLSSIFYQSALDAAKGAEGSRVNLERVRAIEAAARAQIAEERAALDAFMLRELPQLHRETQQLFVAVDADGNCSVDALATAINQYAALLGKQLQFESMAEFDDFMLSDQSLRL